MQEERSSDRQYIEELKTLIGEIGGSPIEIKQLAVHLLATLVGLTSKGSPVVITQTETGIKLDVYETGAPRFILEYSFPNASRYTVVPRETKTDSPQRCKTEWDDELTTRVEIAAAKGPRGNTLEHLFQWAKIEEPKRE